MYDKNDDLTKLQPVRKQNSDQTKPDDATRIVKPDHNKLRYADDKTRLASKRVKKAEKKLVENVTNTAKPTAKTIPNPPDIKPGALIKNRFKLEFEIGRGAMGIVYVVRDLRKEELGDRDSLMAIKLLTEDFKKYPDSLRMLQQECKKAQELAHPNIVTVYDFDRDGDMVYMTMEYLIGRPLTDLMDELDNEPAELEIAVPIITDIVNGLDYAHRKGIIHSDLKPANIFLTDLGPAKILDFGIARAVKHSRSEQITDKLDRQQSRETKYEQISASTVALTPAYASPEMFAMLPPDPRDDVFALACITYELLSGKHPYAKCPADQALKKHLIPERIAGLNERQWNALLHGLALQRERRIASVQEFLEAFLPKRKEPWKIAAFIIALTAAISTAYFLLKAPEIVAPSLFENPPEAALLSAKEQRQIDDMLELAEVHLLVGRVISPPESNALDMYNKVLKKHPYDRRAIAGLKQLLATLTRLARVEMDKGNREKAKQLIEVGLNIHDQHTGLLQLQRELAENN